ncbi:uncharacterized protein LOC131619325 [Vicia villosa]|uniref:uncharacterized protein LOC131619325 n=1 Tax=Vicia villosa TaxID=3911 RepID=UPI00273B5A71|nr:uncharacterized protein LOC131619325 [Vicia villosa]
MLDFELLRGYTRKGGTPRCMLQLDLQKAYAMVDWYALEHVMQEIGKERLKAGDLISPLLFALMMEYLNRLLVKMHSHAKCEKAGITNLTFADDILMFCKGDITSVQMLIKTVQDFFDSIGLVINPRKCKVFYGGTDRDTKEQLIRSTSFEEGILPMKYLGVPITRKRLNIHHYMPLIEKIMKRMKHWTSKLLSYSGRILLVKSVILAITQYWMQCVPIPQFAGSMDNSRKSPVAWQTMCSPKNQGGQGIINLTI